MSHDQPPFCCFLLDSTGHQLFLLAFQSICFTGLAVFVCHYSIIYCFASPLSLSILSLYSFLFLPVPFKTRLVLEPNACLNQLINHVSVLDMTSVTTSSFWEKMDEYNLGWIHLHKTLQLGNRVLNIWLSCPHSKKG